jgi:uncharacterized membrane protein YoaT (DUF817 family)
MIKEQGQIYSSGGSGVIKIWRPLSVKQIQVTNFFLVTISYNNQKYKLTFGDL